MRAGLATVALVLGLSTLAACVDPGPVIRVEDAWSRPSAPSGSMPGVAYLSIVNEGGAADRLIGARSKRCRTVEIHETRVVDDRMSMVPVREGLPVGRRSTVAFKPGGLHLMLLGLTEPLRAGESYEMTLTFERVGERVVDVEVRRP